MIPTFQHRDSLLESIFPHSCIGCKGFTAVSRTGNDTNGFMDKLFDMFEKGLNNLKSQFVNGGTSAVKNSPSNIGRTNNVFKLNRSRPAATKIFARQGISPKGSNGSPFTVFYRPSSTRSKVGKQYPVWR